MAGGNPSLFYLDQPSGWFFVALIRFAHRELVVSDASASQSCRCYHKANATHEANIVPQGRTLLGRANFVRRGAKESMNNLIRFVLEQ